jgi:transposase
MARLRPYFPKSHGKPRVDDRRVLSEIIFVNRNGSRWCDAPKDYGPHKTLYNRWKRWGEMGVFLRMMEGLTAELPRPSCFSQQDRCRSPSIPLAFVAHAFPFKRMRSERRLRQSWQHPPSA